ncbi:DUF6232 family protein [Oecophyllibacter saccharovorans]|uniref:Uncharacterized protein n=1 Tax=Oecophyllibacter saccharovorans TaxID=2558360 RepID=A0A506UKR2_9PROT|nr:DUF6232 family protein [Oecophyllibacter saccharovorans]QDH15069.1 hypothetical protein E3E11_03390 [Oecophyllibacter saccharovorans]TPW33908.1 hypothetical protein E3202_04780 [Oecophyllibacter saccharovorans]TPW35251.1 hypothetical protein E3203_07295 [Oecophyllibacter saccharovorans]
MFTSPLPPLFQNGTVALTSSGLQVGEKLYALKRIRAVRLSNRISRTAAMLLFAALALGVICCVLSGWELVVAAILAVACLGRAWWLGRRSFRVLILSLTPEQGATGAPTDTAVLASQDHALIDDLAQSLGRTLQQNTDAASQSAASKEG